jgi:hypothetical protein
MPERLVALLLREWRQAERDLDSLPSTAKRRDRADAERRVETLRAAYQESARALEQLHAAGTRPAPDLVTSLPMEHERLH